MFKTILVPTDGSSLSKLAENAAIEFARLSGGSVVALSLAQPDADGAALADVFVTEGTGDLYGMLELAEDRLQAFLDRCHEADIPCQCSMALSYHPYEEILQAAADFQCDAIFIASHDQEGVTQVLLGSETQKVLANANLPVMVFR